MEKIIAIIPSRMGAKRLPGKPMSEIIGMPMIEHVYRRTKMCADLSEVYVATCDEEIADYIRSIGGKVVFTSDKHLRSTDRVAEALRILESENNETIEIVVMVQGDEPLVNEQMISGAISPLHVDQSVDIVNLMAEITNNNEINDSNSVKVVTDFNNYALYMSRSPIPFQDRDIAGLPVLKKVNVVAMRRGLLYKYASLPPTPIELVESIGMLRLLESGVKIKMVLSETYTVSVDTKKDLEIARELMKDDFWLEKYLK